MRDFDPLGLQRDREIDHLVDVRNIGAVHDYVDCKRQTEPYHFGRKRNFALERAGIPGDVIR